MLLCHFIVPDKLQYVSEALLQDIEVLTDELFFELFFRLQVLNCALSPYILEPQILELVLILGDFACKARIVVEVSKDFLNAIFLRLTFICPIHTIVNP